MGAPTGLALLVACGTVAGPPPQAPPSPTVDANSPLVKARRSFVTRLVKAGPTGEAPPEAPPGLFHRVRFPSPVGALWAYVTPDPADKSRRPAMVWITGGDSNSLGPMWDPTSPENDQNATALRQSGLVMMFPSLRGGAGNPGRREGFLGEVDDVLAAADYVAGLPYVDPERIYLGGHSTGGTLALLVAASTRRFGGVFAFGPVSDVAGYGGSFVYCDPADAREMKARSPVHWMDAIETPTFLFEGDGDPANVGPLFELAKATRRANLHAYFVLGTDHFSVLDRVNRVLGPLLVDTPASVVERTIVAEAPKLLWVEPVGCEVSLRTIGAAMKADAAALPEKDRGQALADTDKDLRELAGLCEAQAWPIRWRLCVQGATTAEAFEGCMQRYLR